MLGSYWLYVIASGLGALCLSTASAGERVTLNETVLDCAPGGCVIVRYVPVPSLKPEQHQSGSSQSKSAEKGAENNERHADEYVLASVGQPEPESKQRDADSAKANEKNGSLIKGRTVRGWLWGLVNSASALTAWGTWAAAIIAGIAVRYLRGTLRASQRAEDNTGRLLIAETRPWIQLSIHEISVEDAEPRDEKTVVVSYRAINCGKGPALNIVTQMKVIDTALVRVFFNDNKAVREFYEDCRRNYSLQSSANMNSLLPIPESANTGSVDETVSLPILDEPDLALGDRKFCLAMCSTYKDAIGNVHQTGLFAHAIDDGPYSKLEDGSTLTTPFKSRDQPVYMDIKVKAEGAYHT